jgi:hypothetical protein
MIERGWFDAEFMRAWSNAPLLVRSDTGQLLRASGLSADGEPAGVAQRFVAWDARVGRHRSIERLHCDEQT